MNENNFCLSQQLGFLLRDQGLKLALAESCTAGGLAHQITAVPGSAAWFDCGFVVYSNHSKTKLLGVDPDLISQHGAVSEEVVSAMAIGAIDRSLADVSLSITGIAGPGGGTPEKPVGTVWFGLARREGACMCRVSQFFSGRQQIRTDAMTFALRWLLGTLS